MTQPSLNVPVPGAPPSSADAQQQRTDRYAQLLLQIEQAAVRAATGRLIIALALARRQATGRLLLAVPGAEARVAEQVAVDLEQDALPLLADDVVLPAVLASAREAIGLGTVYNLGPGNPFVPALPPEPEVTRAVLSAAATARERVQAAVRQLGTARTPDAVATAVRTAEGAIGAVATGAEYAVNSAANSAPRRLAVALGQRLVWVAERDACVVCLALSGDVIDPNQGEAFDEFATFDPKLTPPQVWPPGMPLVGPPRHPHCRCIVQVWAGHAVPGTDTWPDRLKHEALRSIARGWSLPSESNAARLRAAEHIVRTGRARQLPKSVQAEAVRAASTGRFTRRTVP